MNKYLFASLFTFFCLYSNAQKIKSIVSTRTYFYPDSTPPTIIDSNVVMLFDSQERLIRQDDIEGVCYQSYAYDETGKMIINNNYCGEGFMECTYSYLANIRYEKCISAMNEYYATDSLNQLGKILKSTQKVIEWSSGQDDTMEIYQYIYSYQYDLSGREVCKKKMNENGVIIYQENRSYNDSGMITSFTAYGEDGIPLDSILYSYDWANRFTRLEKFSRFSKGKIGLTEVLSVQYASLNTPAREDQKLNDTLIQTHLFSAMKYDDINLSPQPASIKHSIINHDDVNGYENLDVTFRYNYDDKARLIEIKGKGTYDADRKTLNIENHIVYSGKNKALLTFLGEDHYGYSAKGNTFEYENGLLIKSTEKAKDGFLFATDVYRYTFYK